MEPREVLLLQAIARSNIVCGGLGRRKLFSFSLILLANFVLYPQALHALTNCKSEVSFKWKKDDKESTVLVSRVSRSGADEAAAKRALDEAIAREKGAAMESCKHQHENVTGCMNGKFASLGPALQSASFNLRKHIEDAVAKECKENQGTCSDVLSSEVQCEEIKKAENADAAKAETSKKEEKAKGKKK